MGFRCEIQNRIRTMVAEQPGHGRPVGDVRLGERHTCVFERPLEIQQTAGVGQLVDDDEAIGGVIEDVVNEVGSDETRRRR